MNTKRKHEYSCQLLYGLEKPWPENKDAKMIKAGK